MDKQFNKVKEFKGFVWDIWFQVEGRNVIRNTNEIKSKKNKTYYILKNIIFDLTMKIKKP